MILNVILPLLPSCWGFSFALRRGVSVFVFVFVLVGSNILLSMSEKVGLKFNIQKTKIIVSGWEIDGETMETVKDFIFLVSKITDGDYSLEIERHLLLGRKAMTNLDSILKSGDITLLTNVRLVKAMVFPVVMYGCESWTIKKAEC